jgi:hypothetical protein
MVAARSTNNRAVNARATYPMMVPVLPNWKIPMQSSQTVLPFALVLPNPPRKTPATRKEIKQAAP